MIHLRTFLRGASFGLSGFLVILGAFSFINDVLGVLHVIAPAGDGPYGIIAGPIFILIGGVWFAWLRGTRTVPD